MAGSSDMDVLFAFGLTLIGFFPAIAVVWAVLSRSKTVAALAQLGGLQGRELAQEQFEHAKGSMSQAVRKQDQASFTLGVMNVAITTYLLGAVPRYFYLWHTPKVVFLISFRWYTFRQEGKHYLLYDFCYWANARESVPTRELLAHAARPHPRLPYRPDPSRSGSGLPVGDARLGTSLPSLLPARQWASRLERAGLLAVALQRGVAHVVAHDSGVDLSCTPLEPTVALADLATT